MENTIKHSNFEQGPPIDEGLVTWLDAEAIGRRIQLPIEIYSGPLGIESSYLRAGNTEIEIDLDTTAMSLDLPMQLKPYCSSYPCRVWLEGTWGALISDSPQENLPVFAVRMVVGIASEHETNIRFPKSL